jgi:hypothetical protein
MRQDELDLAKHRMRTDGVAASRPLTFKIFFDIFKVCFLSSFLLLSPRSIGS